MNSADFLRAMHRRIPADYGIAIKLLPGTTRNYPTDLLQQVCPEDTATVEYFFSALPRRLANNEADRGFLVWCDADGSIDDPENMQPVPSCIIHTGRANGYHLYWHLNAEIPAERAAQISRLAGLAYDADMHWCNTQFTGRMPGSINPKYPGVRAKLLKLDEELEYDPEVIEEIFVANIFAQHYEDGERHTITLALAGILMRAAWSLQRTQRCISYLYSLHPGSDLQGKLTAVSTTYTRGELGETISTAKIRAILEKENFLNFLIGLGITSRDGDLIVEGEVIGKAQHVEREMVNYFLSLGNWGCAQGKLVRWSETHWRVADTSELAGEVFSLLSTAKYVVKGEVKDFPATAKTARAVSGMVEGALLKSPLPDPNPDYLFLQNGVLNLHTRELMPSVREFGHTWIVPVEYREGASSLLWESFVRESAPDADIREHLQEWMGYCLMGGNKYQRMLWLHGPSGTGKSTFIHGIELLLGPAGVAINTDKINEYTVAQLSNVRAALCGELSPKMLHTSTIKSLIAGDPVQARHPYGRPFTVVFTGKFAWASNALPPLDQGEGMWRRIVPVEFTTKPRKKDDLLREKLAQPDQLSGLLNWALEGLVRLVQNTSWKIPAAVSSTIKAYQMATDTAKRFAEEEIIYKAEDRVPVLDVYKRFSAWADDRGFRTSPLGPLFFQDMKRAGLEVDTEHSEPKNPTALYFKGGSLRPLVFEGVGTYAMGAN